MVSGEDRHIERDAFTLVELLVVIGIIAILVGLLSMGLTRAKNKTRTIQCINNVRQLGLGHSLYVDDYGLLGSPWSVRGLSPWWFDYIKPYVTSNTGVVLCPATRENPAKLDEVPFRYGRGAADMPYSMVFSNPITQPPARGVGSYGFNIWLNNGNDTPSVWFFQFFKTESAIQRPSATPVFADSSVDVTYPFESHAPARDLYTLYDPGIDSYMAPYTLARHGGRTAHGSLPVAPGESLRPYVNNIVFVDGHAEAIKLDDLWNLYWHAKWEPPAPRPP